MGGGNVREPPFITGRGWENLICVPKTNFNPLPSRNGWKSSTPSYDMWESATTSRSQPTPTYNVYNVLSWACSMNWEQCIGRYVYLMDRGGGSGDLSHRKFYKLVAKGCLLGKKNLNPHLLSENRTSTPPPSIGRSIGDTTPWWYPTFDEIEIYYRIAPQHIYGAADTSFLTYQMQYLALKSIESDVCASTGILIQCNVLRYMIF